MSGLPDIVVDTKLDVEVHDKFTIHYDRPDITHSTDRPIRNQERWKRAHCIGGGGFGTVWQYTCVSGHSRGQHRAVKKIQQDGDGLPSSRLVNELEAIGKFSQGRYQHCFVRSLGWYETDSQLSVVMEFLDKGDLDAYIHAPLLESEAA